MAKKIKIFHCEIKMMDYVDEVLEKTEKEVNAFTSTHEILDIKIVPIKMENSNSTHISYNVFYREDDNIETKEA